MNLTRNIQSVSTFKRETRRLIAQVKTTREPLILTVNDRAEVVVLDLQTHQELLALKDRMESIAGIRAGLESMKRGEGRPLDEFITEFFAKHNIPQSADE